MISPFLTLALLTVTDPAIGPSAAETLTPPSSALYRSLAPFDLQEASVLDGETLELQLQLGSYANPLDLPNGFSHPVIEVYLGGGEFGNTELLPGSGMVLPDGDSWTVAFQLTGDQARGWFVDAEGVHEFEPELQLLDDHLFVITDLPSWPQPKLAAVTGLYSPFHQDGWRPLETAVNPWAFSSSEQVLPVIDVLALDSESQLLALSGGVLPVTEVNLIENPNTLWFSLMALGLAVAGVGLVLRGMARRPAAVEPAAKPEEEVQPAATPVAAATVAVPEAQSEEVASEADSVPEPQPAATGTDPLLATLKAPVSVDDDDASETAPTGEQERFVPFTIDDEALTSVDKATTESVLVDEALAGSVLVDEAVTESVVVDEQPAVEEPGFSSDPDDYALPEYASVDFGEFELTESDSDDDGIEEDEEGDSVA